MNILRDVLKQNNFDKLSISIPTYNEESNIQLMIEECLEFLGDENDILELIIVNDKSSDKSLEVAPSASTPVLTLLSLRSQSRIGTNNTFIPIEKEHLLGLENCKHIDWDI